MKPTDKIIIIMSTSIMLPPHTDTTVTYSKLKQNADKMDQSMGSLQFTMSAKRIFMKVVSTRSPESGLAICISFI